MADHKKKRAYAAGYDFGEASSVPTQHPRPSNVVYRRKCRPQCSASSPRADSTASGYSSGWGGPAVAARPAVATVWTNEHQSRVPTTGPTCVSATAAASPAYGNTSQSALPERSYEPTAASSRDRRTPSGYQPPAQHIGYTVALCQLPAKIHTIHFGTSCIDSITSAGIAYGKYLPGLLMPIRNFACQIFLEEIC